MDELLRECLFPVMLGSNTPCHACVRRLQKDFGTGSTVLTGKRALTLRFLPGIRVLDAPPSLGDELLLAVLSDVCEDSGLSLPLLVLCDDAYAPFLERNRHTLEAKFILRSADELLGGKQ